MYLEEKREAEAPVVDSPERKVILDVIALLSEPGVWIGEPPHRRLGKHCINTAFNVQLGLHHLGLHHPDVVRSAHSVVGRVIGISPNVIPAWNDAPGRTLDEVLTVLRKAAELV